MGSNNQDYDVLSTSLCWVKILVEKTLNVWSGKLQAKVAKKT